MRSRDSMTFGTPRQFRRIAYLGTIIYAVVLGVTLWYAAPKMAVARILGWTVRLDHEHFVIASASSPTGLKSGDIVVAVNGREIGKFSPNYWLHGYPLKQPYTMAIRRAGTVQQLSLRIGRRIDWNRAAPSIVDLFCSLVFFLMSAVIVWKRPDAEVVRRLSLAGFLAALFFLFGIGENLNIMGWPTPPTWALWAIDPWDYVVAYWFLSVFPKPVPESRFWRTWWKVLIAVAVLDWLLLLPANLSWLNLRSAWAIEWMPLWLRIQPFGMRANAIAETILIASLPAILARNYLSLKAPADRIRLRWVLAAFGTTAAVISFGGLRVLWAPVSFILLEYRNAAAVLIPVALAWSIIKHQLLDISLVVRRSLQYFLARRTLEVLMVTPLVAIAVRAALNPGLTVRDVIHPAALYGGMLVFGGVGILTRRRSLAALDRRFFRAAWDQEQILGGLLEAIRQELSFRTTVQLAREKIVEALHPDALEVIYRPSRYSPLQTIDGAIIPNNFELFRAMECQGVLRADGQRFALLPAEEKDWMRQHRATLMIAMPAREGSIAGMLLLGDKKSDQPWTAAEVKLLQAIAAHIGLAYENELLALERLEAVSAERNRLARELHDTLAQGFAGISLHLASAQTDLHVDPNAAEHHLQQARLLARSSLAEARRSVYDLRVSARLTCDLVPKLQELAGRLSSPGSMLVRVEAPGAIPLPESLSANLFRIAQESITNAMKHSGATEIAVLLDCDQRDIRLSVRDNGRGFDPCVRRPGGYGLMGIEERAAEMKAKVDVRSRRGEGTEVIAIVQYAEA
jgi:signal transduction histidine kinase